MKLRLFTIFSAVSLLLAIVVVAMWVRSRSWAEDWMYAVPHTEGSGRSHLRVLHGSGLIRVEYSTTPIRFGTDTYGFSYYRTDAEIPGNYFLTEPTPFGLTRDHSDQTGNTCWDVTFPDWAAVLEQFQPNRSA